MSEQTEHIATFTIEQYLCEELGHDVRTQIESHLDSCSMCATILKEQKDKRHAFLLEKPFLEFQQGHRDRLNQTAAKTNPLEWLFGKWSFPLVGVLAGAAAVVLVAIVPGTITDSTHQPTTRIKGSPYSLSAMGLVNDTLQPLPMGTTITPGMTINLAYNAGDHTHMALFGIDGSGNITLFFPEGKETLAPLPNGPKGNLPFSLTFDAVPGRERFIAIYTTGEKSLAPIRDALQKLSQEDVRLDLPSDYNQANTWLDK